MNLLGMLFGPIMRFCYGLSRNYGMAIILFTIITKILLMPLSVWLQKNSIKMVKMQPEVNRIHIEHFGDSDTISDLEQKLYKKNKYNAFASLIPLAIQIVLLMGVVEVIYHPMNYILDVPQPIIEKFNEITLDRVEGIDPESSSLQLYSIQEIQSGAEEYRAVPDSAGEIEKIEAMSMKFLGFDLSWTTSLMWGKTIWVPLLAGLSSLLLSVCQNAANVLQVAQTKWNRYGMLVLSVGLSLYLGMFVPAGVALYWVASNLIAIATLYGLNWAINPKKYVDYAALNDTRAQLAALEANAKKKKRKHNDPLYIREKEDYERFFSIGNKHLVFYSESNGFYKYYAGIIEYLLKNTNIPIHYITSDANDHIFEMAKETDQIQAYFIEENKLITLMMKMDADIVVMTMPDLENFHIKRSYVRKDIEYIYISHGMGSNTMLMRKGSMDHYDTVMVTGIIQRLEVEQTEEVYGLPKKKVVDVGYPLLDDMLKNYEAYRSTHQKSADEQKMVLIAPSWQKDNIVDSCLDDLLDSLKGHGYKVVVRPHPQHVRHMPEKMEALKERFKDDPNVVIQTDFSDTNTVLEADMLITDWSDIATEYVFTTLRPVLYINTPMKIMNPEYTKIKAEPLNLIMRRETGKDLDPANIKEAHSVVQYLLDHSDEYQQKNYELREANVYNIGTAGKTGAEYLIQDVFAHVKEAEEHEKK